MATEVTKPKDRCGRPIPHFPAWGFWRLPVPAYHDPDVLRSMLCEAMDFIVSELDPEPHHWEAYFNSKEHQAIATTLERWHRIRGRAR